MFIADSPAGEIYGFQLHGVPRLKIANHAGGERVDLDTVDRSTRPGENQDCLELAERVIRGIMPHVVKSAVSLYTMTPDTDFIIDRHPVSPGVAIGAGLSGHGFKFAQAIGEPLAGLIVYPAAESIHRVQLSRFQENARDGFTNQLTRTRAHSGTDLSSRTTRFK